MRTVRATNGRNQAKGRARSLFVLFALLSGLLATIPSHAVIDGAPCWETSSNPEPPAPITAAGSTTQLALHLYNFIPAYERRCPATVGTIGYQALGDTFAADAAMKHSRGTDTAKPYTFYPSDLPLSSLDKTYAEFDLSHPFNPRTGSLINHFPAMVNGFAVGYNVDNCSSVPLRFSSLTLGLIYSGVILRWNDPRLVADNPQLANCNMGIQVSIRSDEHSSTTVFKDYLSQSNPMWNFYKTKQFATLWPTTLGIGCRAAPPTGMSSCLDRSGSIGYVEYRETVGKSTYRLAEVQNSAGSFVAPSTNRSLAYPDNCTIAAQSVPSPAFSTSSDWSSFSLTKATAGYPVCAYSYLLVFARLMYSYDDAIATAAVRNTVDYLATIAQDSILDSVTGRGFAPLPATPHQVRETLRAGIQEIRF